jgi:hypothetical protein
MMNLTTGSRRNVAFILRAASTVLLGLIAGMMQEEYFFLKVVLRDVSPEVWAHVQSNFRLLHPYTVVPMAVAGVMAVLLTLVFERASSKLRRWLTWLAVAMGLSIGVLTAVVMMPINDAIFAWTSMGVPPDWTKTRDEWILFQAIRAVASTAGFICLGVAAGLPNRAEDVVERRSS